MPNISDSGGHQSGQRILRYQLYGKTTPLPITLLQVWFTCLRNISIETKDVEHGLQSKLFFNLAPLTLRLAWGLLKANNNNISFICMTIRKVQISKKCEFTEKFCEFINLIISSVQDIWLKSQNFVGFEQCNRKWNSSSIIPELQTGQNLSMWGVWLYLPEFQSWDRNLHKSFLLVKMMSTRYTLRIPRDRYLVDVYRIAVKLSRNSRNKIKWYRPGITHWNYVLFF